MAPIDIAIVVIAAASFVISAWKGLVKELFSVAAVAVAVWAGWNFGPVIAERLKNIIANPLAARVSAFAAVFVAAAVGLSVAGFLLSKAVHATPLKWIDILAGGVFGFLKAMVLMSLAFLFMVTVWRNTAGFLGKSLLAPRMIKGAVVLSGVVDEFAAEFGAGRLDLANLTRRSKDNGVKSETGSGAGTGQKDSKQNKTNNFRDRASTSSARTEIIVPSRSP